MSNSTFFAITNVLSVIIGVFVGLALADVTAGVTILQQWQTLLAGALAVLAALVTVFQMQISDRNHQTRHDEVTNYDRELRKLVVGRAGVAFADELRSANKHYGELADGVTFTDLVHEPWRGFGTLTEYHGEMSRLSHRDALREVRPFLTNQADRAFAGFRNAIEDFGKKIAERRDIFAVTPYEEVPSNAYDPVFESRQTLRIAAEKLAASLEMLEHGYSIEKS